MYRESFPSMSCKATAGVAEQRLTQANARIESLESELELTRGMLDRADRRQRVEELLAEYGARDIGFARLLADVAMSTMVQPDPRCVIEDLRRNEPYLFRQSHKKATFRYSRTSEERSKNHATPID